MTHEECRKKICFICLKKGDGRTLSASLVDFIVHGIFPEYETVKNFLPCGLCGACSARISKFMSKKQGNPEDFQHAQSREKYDEIIHDLQSVFDRGCRQCACIVCSLARTSGKGIKRPFSKDLPQNLQEAPLLAQEVLCPSCYTVLSEGGYPHSCSRKIRVQNLMQRLSPATKQQLASSIIKEEKSSQSSTSGEVHLKTGGRPLKVLTEEPKPAKQSHDLFWVSA